MSLAPRRKPRWPDTAHRLSPGGQAQNLVVSPNFPFARPVDLRHFDKAADRTTTHSGPWRQVTTSPCAPVARSKADQDAVDR